MEVFEFIHGSPIFYAGLLYILSVLRVIILGKCRQKGNLVYEVLIEEL
jgi:hypothetical protein